jgi:hypothetical protein
MAININPGANLRHVATYTSSGTFKVPEGTSVVFASIRGASGGGGFGQSDTNRYGGQNGRVGGNGLVAGGFVQVTPGRDHTVTIGAAGGGGGTGGTSSFDGAITVTGGTGGSQTSAGTAGQASAVTSLTTLPPNSASSARAAGFITQSTGANAGGSGGGTAPWGQGAQPGGGSGATIEIYI